MSLAHGASDNDVTGQPYLKYVPFMHAHLFFVLAYHYSHRRK